MKKRARPSYAAKVDRFVATLDADRRAGVTLWQILVQPPGSSDNHYAVTSEPERFIAALIRGEVIIPQSGPPKWDLVGIGVLPLALETCPDSQLAAVLTLPRDRVLTRAEVTAHGVTIHQISGTHAATMRAEWNKHYH